MPIFRAPTKGLRESSFDLGCDIWILFWLSLLNWMGLLPVLTRERVEVLLPFSFFLFFLNEQAVELRKSGPTITDQTNYTGIQIYRSI